MPENQSLRQLLADLPSEPDEAALFPEILEKVAASGRKLVVIDDDPTGVQTVHDVVLFTTWDEQVLAKALQEEPKLFFLLTNSRSFPAEEAAEINCRIAGQLKATGDSPGFVIASRSDSTLRGHYPAEIEALESALGGYDGHLIVPAFFEGGRYTINDTHYVASPTANSDNLIPAHLTPFAQDKVFGYSTAYLPAWVEEKSQGRWKAAEVVSLDLATIRQGGPSAVAALLNKVEGGRPVIVNAAGYGDLAVVVLGLLEAEANGKRFLYRTAAGFVRVRGAVRAKPLLTTPEILAGIPKSAKGGLVVVGSYVPGSSAQLENLVKLPGLVTVELDVNRVNRGESEANAACLAASQQLEAALAAGKTTVLYTSRQLVSGQSHAENLAIGGKVSQALVRAIHGIQTPPRFILAKGGITSHVVAQHGLGTEKARALGQLIAGVPVWRLESGPALKFAGVPYIVFPGNVGGPDSLVEAVLKLSGEG